MPVACAQLLFGIIANHSSHEHRMAICTATDSLCHMRVRILYPIFDRSSGKFPRFLPLRRILSASCLRELPVTLTTRPPFLVIIGGLVPGYPGTDREALRSFPPLHAVRFLDIVCVSVVQAVSDLV